MGLYQFRLPDVGEGVAEAEIVAWHVKVGDTIKEDQSLVDVMTDKATVDMTSPVDGVVVSLHGEIGELAPVGSVIVELEVEGPGNLAETPARTPQPAPAAPRTRAAGSACAPSVARCGRPTATASRRSPAAR